MPPRLRLFFSQLVCRVYSAFRKQDWHFRRDQHIGRRLTSEELSNGLTDPILWFLLLHFYIPRSVDAGVSVRPGSIIPTKTHQIYFLVVPAFASNVERYPGPVIFLMGRWWMLAFPRLACWSKDRALERGSIGSCNKGFSHTLHLRQLQQPVPAS